MTSTSSVSSSIESRNAISCRIFAASPSDVGLPVVTDGRKFIASAEAKPWSGPIQVTVTESTNGRLHRAVIELTSATVNNGVPGGYQSLVVEATDQLWLTLLPAPAAKTDEQKK